MKTKFIAIEGGEGSGKSSVLKAVLKELKDFPVVVTREPGGSPYGEVIREIALKHELAKQASSETMLCLMFASRFDHCQNKIKPLLESGTTVISDRFDASSYAYNVWAQSGGKLEELFWALRKELSILPDLYIYFSVDVREGLRRAHSRNLLTSDGNHFDDRKVDFHEKIKEGYEKFFLLVPHVIIDANQPFDIVKADLLKVLNGELV